MGGYYCVACGWSGAGPAVKHYEGCPEWAKLGPLDEARYAVPREKETTRGVGKKDSKGKPDLTTLLGTHPSILTALAEIDKGLAWGEGHYGRNNWRGVPQREYLKAAIRHVAEFLMGRTTDSRTGVHHLGLAGCNILFALALFFSPPGTDPEDADPKGFSPTEEGKRDSRGKPDPYVPEE